MFKNKVHDFIISLLLIISLVSIINLKANANNFYKIAWQIEKDKYGFIDYTPKGEMGWYTYDGVTSTLVSSKVKLVKIKNQIFYKVQLVPDQLDVLPNTDGITYLSKQSSNGLAIFTNPLEVPKKILLPFFKEGDLFFDLFMVTDYEDNQDYLKLLRTNGIDPSTICKTYDCAIENINKVQYLSLIDTETKDYFNFELTKDDADQLAKAKQLKKFFTYGILTSTIPKSWSKLNALEEIAVINAGLEQVEVELKNLPQLERLVLKGNWLEFITVGGPQLKKCELSNNNLLQIELDKSIRQLQAINLADNRLVNFSFEEGTLEQLRYLNLYNNELSAFTTGYFPAITHFFIHSNPVEQLILKRQGKMIALGIPQINNLKLQGSSSLQFLLVDKVTKQLTELYLPQIESLEISNVTIGDNWQLRKDHFSNLSKISVGKIDEYRLNKLVNELKPNHIHLNIFDANIIQKFRFQYPETHIGYSKDGEYFPCPKLSKKENYYVNLLKEKNKPNLYISYKIFQRRKDTNLIYELGNQLLKTEQYNLQPEERLKLRLQQAMYAEQLNPNYLEELTEENISNNKIINSYKSVVSATTSIFDPTTKNKLIKQINFAKSKCYEAYYKLYAEIRDDNLHLLGNTKTLYRQSGDLKESGSNFKEAGETILSEIDYDQQIQSLDNNYYGTTYDDTPDISAEMAYIGLAVYGVGEIFKFFGKRKKKKADKKKYKASQVLEKLKTLEKELIKYSTNA